MNKITKKDIKSYILVIQTNFENAYKFETETEYNLLYTSWLKILEKYPKEICDIAVTNALAKAKFAPRIGDIVEEIENIENAGKKTDEELCAELADIKYEVYDISRDLRYPQHYENARAKLLKIYDNLSEELRLYLVNLNALIEFSEIPNESLTYEKNAFYKRMPVLRKHMKNKAAATQFLSLVNETKMRLPEIKKD